MLLTHASATFLEFLRVQRGLAEHTLKAYRADLERLTDYLSEGSRPKPRLADVSPLDLKDFAVHLRDSLGYRPASLSRTLSTLRVFFRHAVEKGWLKKSPAIGLRNPKNPRKLPVFLGDQEIPRLLVEGVRSSPAPDRDRAILMTFLFTGLRLAELAGLRVGSIDSPANVIRVVGKGSKERAVPIHPVLREVLARHLGTLVDRSPDAPLFVSERGRAMTPRMVSYVVQKAVLSAALSHRITPHKLRHTFATQLLHNGASLLEIKELLGHSQLATTSIYTHTVVERLRSAVDRLDLAS